MKLESTKFARVSGRTRDVAKSRYFEGAPPQFIFNAQVHKLYAHIFIHDQRACGTSE
jgi:hypothetical protein